MSGEAASKVLEDQFKAARDMSAHQYKGVYLSANDTIDVPTAATNFCAGVLQDKPKAAGRAARVVFMGKTKAYVGGGTLTYGQSVAMTTSGWFIKTLSGYHADGIVTQGANSGFLAEIFLIPGFQLAVSSAQTAQG